MGEPVIGLLLAGGQARRMGGGDKCLRPLAGRTILDWVIERARPQVSSLVLNVNGDPARFERFALPIAIDPIEGHAGPLAGVLAGMRWAERHEPATRWLVSLPTDTPFLPLDLVSRLLAARQAEGADLACAASAGRSHPVVGLWDIRLADALEAAMVDEQMRKIDLWTARYRLATVPFACTPIDPFFNTNRIADLEEAETLARQIEARQ